MKKINLKKIIDRIGIDEYNENDYFYEIEDLFNEEYQNKIIKNKKGDIIGINLFSCFDERQQKIFFQIIKTDKTHARRIQKEISAHYEEFNKKSDNGGECVSVYIMDYIAENLDQGNNIFFMNYDDFSIKNNFLLLNKELSCYYQEIARLVSPEQGMVEIEAGYHKGFRGEYYDDFLKDEYNRPSAVIVLDNEYADDVYIPYGYFMTESLIMRNKNKENFINNLF